MQTPKKIITDLKILRAPNKNVSLEEGKSIIKDLELSLSSSLVPGVGLAAPQIGVNKTVCIVRCKINNSIENLDLINPIIIDKKHPIINSMEACLSLPGIKVNTRRFKEIFLKDENNPSGIVVTGFTAIVAQHEIDHLEGILVTDRAIGKDKVGRNDPCPCGKKINGKVIKFKKCHGRDL